MLTIAGLATQIGITGRQMARRLDRLEALGWIRVEPMGDGRPGRITVLEGAPEGDSIDIPAALARSLAAGPLLAFSLVSYRCGTRGWSYAPGDGTWTRSVATRLGVSERTAERYLSTLLRQRYLAWRDGKRGRLLCPTQHSWTTAPGAMREVDGELAAPVPVPDRRVVIDLADEREHRGTNLEPTVRAMQSKSSRADRVAALDDLSGAWRSAYGSAYPGTPVLSWTRWERRVAADLVDELGLEMTSRLIRHAIETWSQRDRLGGFPTLRMIRTLAQDLLAEITVGGGQVRAGLSSATLAVKTRRERINRDEYNAERAKKFPSVGWGPL